MLTEDITIPQDVYRCYMRAAHLSEWTIYGVAYAMETGVVNGFHRVKGDQTSHVLCVCKNHDEAIAVTHELNERIAVLSALSQ